MSGDETNEPLADINTEIAYLKLLLRAQFLTSTLYRMSPKTPTHAESFAACLVPIGDPVPEILGISHEGRQFTRRLLQVSYDSHYHTLE